MSEIPSEKEIRNVFENRIVKKAGEEVLLYFIKQFGNQGYTEDSTFIPWAIRKDKNNTKPILWETGGMKKSFHLELGKGQFTISNLKDYSKFHQEGTTHMPKRPILYTDDTINKIIEKTVFDELDKLFKK